MARYHPAFAAGAGDGRDWRVVVIVVMMPMVVIMIAMAMR